MVIDPDGDRTLYIVGASPVRASYRRTTPPTGLDDLVQRMQQMVEENAQRRAAGKRPKNGLGPADVEALEGFIHKQRGLWNR